MSHWIYQDQPFQLSEVEIKESNLYGFVYLIDIPEVNRKYVGRKYFWSKRTLPPLKGYKRKRHVTKESDWRTYTSSSDVVNELIENIGKDDMIFKIISLHPNKAETNYHEMKAQFLLNVLEEVDINGDHVYLNGNINMKYYRSEKFNEHRQSITENYQSLINQ